MKKINWVVLSIFNYHQTNIVHFVYPFSDKTQWSLGSLLLLIPIWILVLRFNNKCRCWKSEIETENTGNGQQVRQNLQEGGYGFKPLEVFLTRNFNSDSFSTYSECFQYISDNHWLPVTGNTGHKVLKHRVVHHRNRPSAHHVMSIIVLSDSSSIHMHLVHRLLCVDNSKFCSEVS